METILTEWSRFPYAHFHPEAPHIGWGSWEPVAPVQRLVLMLPQLRYPVLDLITKFEATSNFLWSLNRYCNRAINLTEQPPNPSWADKYLSSIPGLRQERLENDQPAPC